MMQIKDLSVGDKFTETGLLAVSTRIFTVEKFLNNGLVIARDASGWGQAFNETDMIFPCMVVTQQKQSRKQES